MYTTEDDHRMVVETSGFIEIVFLASEGIWVIVIVSVILATQAYTESVTHR